MKCYEALWGAQPIDHDVSTVLVSDERTFWTGGKDGTIIKWTVKEEDKIRPLLYLTYHQSEIVQLIFNSSANVVVSGDANGVFCCWTYYSGLCLQSKKHDFLLGTISGNSAHADTREFCLAFQPLEQEENKEAFHLARMDVLSLEVETVWNCPYVLSFTNQEPSQNCEIVQLMSCCGEGEISISSAIAVTSNGSFLIWQKPENSLNLKDLRKLIFDGGLLVDLRLPVASACFASNGRTVLLVSHCCWCLLQSERLDEETGLPCSFSILAQDFPVFTPPPPEHLPLSFGSAGDFTSGIQKLQKSSTLDDEVIQDATEEYFLGGLVIPGSPFVKQEDQVILLWQLNGQITCFQCNPQGLWSKTGKTTIPKRLKFIKNFQNQQILQICNFQNEAEMMLSIIDPQLDNTVLLKERAKGKISDVWTQKSPRDSNEKTGSSVSCMYMITGLQSCPYILVQGLDNGEILYFSLSWYSTPFPHTTDHPGSFLGTSVGHKAPVVICQEAQFQQPHSFESLFPVNEVQEGHQFMSLLITGAEDGSIMFWSLAPHSFGHSLFSVHPHSAAVKQLLCPREGSPPPPPWSTCVISVSDDGVIAIISLFEKKTVRLLTGSPQKTQLHLTIDYQRGFLLSLARPQLQDSTLIVWDLHSGAQDRIFHGMQAEEMSKLFTEGIEEFHKMHPIEQQEAPPYYREVDSSNLKFIDNSRDNEVKLFKGPKSGLSILEMDIKGLLEALDRDGSSKSLTVRATSSMSVLHVWGVDLRTDSTVLDMIGEMDLLRGGSPSSLDSNNTTFDSSLTQAVVFSSNGAITVDFPYSIEESKIGALWSSNSDFVAGALIVMVALSKQLLHKGFNEVMCTTSSAIATMYAIQFLQLVPQCCNPSLGVVVLLWDDPIEILQDTSRVLLASLTDLTPMYEALTLGEEVTGPGSYEIKTLCTLAENPSNSLSLVLLTQHQMEILVVGAICCVHCRLADPHLVIKIVPFLSTLSTQPIDSARSSVLACLILKEALTGIESAIWFAALSDPANFLTRILDACDQLERTEREKLEGSSSNASPRASTPIMKRRSKPELKESDSPVPDEKAIGGKTRHGRARSVGNLRHVFSRSRFHLETENVDTSILETQCTPSDSYKKALVSLIESISFLDLRLVLATLSQRLPCSCEWPYSVVAVSRAIEGLLRRRDGPQKILQQLPFLISVLVKTLDPSDLHTKRISFNVVLSLLNQMSKLLPMLDIQQESGLIAVGYPLKLSPQLSEGQGPSNHEAIGVFSLQSGSKRRSLSLGRIFEQIAPQLTFETSELAPDLRVGALSFRRDGEVVAAFFPRVSCLCVWDLRMSWQQKLTSSRSHSMTPLEPVKIHQIQQLGLSESSLVSDEVDLSYRLQWQLASQIAVMKGETQLDSVELHLGN